MYRFIRSNEIRFASFYPSATCFSSGNFCGAISFSIDSPNSTAFFRAQETIFLSLLLLFMKLIRFYLHLTAFKRWRKQNSAKDTAKKVGSSGKIEWWWIKSVDFIDYIHMTNTPCQRNNYRHITKSVVCGHMFTSLAIQFICFSFFGWLLVDFKSRPVKIGNKSSR